MKVPFVSFLPMERELKEELREAFSRVLDSSWYIDGKEDKAFIDTAKMIEYKVKELVERIKNDNL